MDPEVA